MQVKFWGVRGSVPSPIGPRALEKKMVDVLVAASDADTSTPEAAKAFLKDVPGFRASTVGGNTPCLEVLDGDHRIILDAGSGIRELGRSLMAGEFAEGKGTVDILISHTHWDHIDGFPFFVPAFIPGNRITFYGCHPRLRQRFKNQHHAFNFPVPLEALPSDVRFRKLTPGRKRRIAGFDVTPRVLHHPGGSYSYRIERGGSTLIYASDATYANLPEDEMQAYHAFYKGADVLVFDAYFALIESYEKSDWGHSSSFIGVDIALGAGVKRLVLFHHDPVSDDERLEGLLESTRNYLKHVSPDSECEIILGHEGLDLEI